MDDLVATPQESALADSIARAIALARAPGRTARAPKYVPGTEHRTAKGSPAGTLIMAQTSKMPCPSFDIPSIKACPFAFFGPGAICGESKDDPSCYAENGLANVFPNIRLARDARFEWTTQALRTKSGQDAWVVTMVGAIAKATRYADRKGRRYFRVHGAGDLFSPAYVRVWIRVCAALPDVRFWFPTRSWRGPWLAIIAELAALPNVTVRPSALHWDDEPPVIEGLSAGSGAAMVGFNCPATDQGNECGDCRHCWDEPDAVAIYHARWTAAINAQPER